MYQDAQAVLRALIPSISYTCEPLDRLDLVNCDTIASCVTSAENCLRICVSILGRKLEPLERLGLIKIDTYTLIETISEFALRNCVPILGRKLVPFDRLDLVDSDSNAIFVTKAGFFCAPASPATTAIVYNLNASCVDSKTCTILVAEGELALRVRVPRLSIPFVSRNLRIEDLDGASNLGQLCCRYLAWPLMIRPCGFLAFISAVKSARTEHAALSCKHTTARCSTMRLNLR